MILFWYYFDTNLALVALYAKNITFATDVATTTALN